MVKVKVQRLDELGNYAYQVNQLGLEYKSELNSASQQLRLKSQGSQSEAVNTYLTKLEHLRHRVFETFPGAIDNYGTHVQSYDTSLTSLGFGTMAWTDGEGNDSVVSKLKNEQVETLKEKSKDLQAALDDATEKLGEDKRDLSSAESTAETSLTTAAQNRNTLYDSMKESYSRFTGNMSSDQALFQTLKYEINNARCITSLDPATVLGAIADGRVDSAALSNMDFIQDTDDGLMFSAIYSDDPYRKMAQVKPDKISDQMMNLVYEKLYSSLPDDLLDGQEHQPKDLGLFIETLSMQDEKDVKTYTLKLIGAGDRYAIIALAKSEDFRAKFPEGNNVSVEDYQAYLQALETNQPAMIKLNEELKKAGALSSVFVAMNVSDFGTKNYSQVEMEKRRWVKKDSLTFNINEKNGRELDFSFVAEYSVDGIRADDEKISSHYYTDSGHIGTAQDDKKIEDLKAKRVEMATDFLKDLVFMGTDFIPGGSIISTTYQVGNSLINESLEGMQVISAAGEVASQVDINEVKYSGKSVKIAADFLQNYLSNEEEIQKAIKDSNSKSFDVGGHAVEKDGKSRYVSFTPQYDLQSYLAVRDLEDYGMKPYVFHKVVGDNWQDKSKIDSARATVNIFSKAVSDSPLNKDIQYTQEVKKLILGKGFGASNRDYQSLFGQEGFKELIDGVKQSGKQVDNFSKIYSSDNEILIDEYNDHYSEYLKEPTD